jgi:small basic protein (TIGR04137 family)
VWGQSKQPLRLQSVEAIARCDVLELACGGARIRMLSQVDGEWPAAAARASSRHATALVQLLRSDRAALVVQPFGQGHRVSGHPSLRGAKTSGAKRNVLKRFERIQLLKSRGQWKPGDRVLGLPKTKP